MHTSIRIVFVICNNAANDQRINLFDRLQHARYEHHIVVASVYKRLGNTMGENEWMLELYKMYTWNNLNYSTTMQRSEKKQIVINYSAQEV
jgi:hypothetical protein